MTNLGIVDLKTATSPSKTWRIQTAGYKALYEEQCELQPELIEDGHIYKLGGLTIPSVSQVIKENFYSSFSSANPRVMDRAVSFGNAFHKASQYLDEGRLDFKSVDPELSPYLLSYEKFKKDFIVQYVEIESVRYSKRLNVAGKIDRVAMLRGESKLMRRIVVIIKSDAYEVIEHKDRSDATAFVSAANLTNWRMVNKLKGASNE